MNQFQENQESSKRERRDKNIVITLSGPTSKENSNMQAKEDQEARKSKMKRILHKVGSKSENKLPEPRLQPMNLLSPRQRAGSMTKKQFVHKSPRHAHEPLQVIHESSKEKISHR